MYFRGGGSDNSDDEMIVMFQSLQQTGNRCSGHLSTDRFYSNLFTCENHRYIDRV